MSGVKELSENEKVFLKYEESYRKSLVGICNLRSTKERRRKIRHFASIFSELKDDELIDTCDPEKLTELDVRYFIAYLREHEIQTSTQVKYLYILNSYLECAGNTAVLKARKKAHITVSEKPIKILTLDEIGTIFATVDRMKGWRGSVAAGMLYIAFVTAIRPGEILYAWADDLNLAEMTFHVRFPKGNGKYQDPHDVSILRPDYNDKLEQYLGRRDAHLLKKGIDPKSVKQLFPNLRSPTFQYSSKSQRTIIREVSKLSGVKFTLKTFRATVISLYGDANSGIDKQISKQAGHKTTQTTERYYYRTDLCKVKKDLGELYHDMNVPDKSAEMQEDDNGPKED